jgi:hypothetical protein
MNVNKDFSTMAMLPFALSEGSEIDTFGALERDSNGNITAYIGITPTGSTVYYDSGEEISKIFSAEEAPSEPIINKLVEIITLHPTHREGVPSEYRLALGI